jgi:hypothetical protein
MILTTYENVTLSANTRLLSFLAGRQSAVLKRAKEVLAGLSAIPTLSRNGALGMTKVSDPLGASG